MFYAFKCLYPKYKLILFRFIIDLRVNETYITRILLNQTILLGTYLCSVLGGLYIEHQIDQIYVLSCVMWLYHTVCALSIHRLSTIINLFIQSLRINHQPPSSRVYTFFMGIKSFHIFFLDKPQILIEL